jgi:hypothetical protein
LVTEGALGSLVGLLEQGPSARLVGCWRDRGSCRPCRGGYGEFEAERGARGCEGPGAVGGTVVAEDLVDGETSIREAADRALQEADRVRSVFLVEDLDVRDAAVVVHGDVRGLRAVAVFSLGFGRGPAGHPCPDARTGTPNTSATWAILEPCWRIRWTNNNRLAGISLPSPLIVAVLGPDRFKRFQSPGRPG